jgi:diguanylate cyclase (GGDEF)-like protein
MSFVTEKIKKTSTLSKRMPKLGSRFLLNDRALKEIKKAEESQQLFSLLMLQIDSFSEIINLWGDLVVEELLVAVHDRLKRHLRPDDGLFSQGGGRFLLLLPKTSERAAALIAKTLLESVTTETFHMKQKEFALTASIGVSAKEKKAPKTTIHEQINTLLATVNKRLQEAKKKGGTIVSQ